MEPTTYAEIEAYKAATGIFMSPLDVWCIKAMDNARVKTTIEVSKKDV